MRLYEAMDGTRWFPPAPSSKRIRHLFTDDEHPYPHLFAIDEKGEYIIATLSQAKSKGDKALPFKGAVISE